MDRITPSLARRALIALAGLLALPAVATAQDVKGVAIAQVPEGEYYTCFGENADDTLACARRACERDGGDPCLRVRWCYPAGWSGSMHYRANEETSQTTFVCGAPSDEGVKAMLSAWCETSPWASDCRLVSLWDPLGNEVGSETPLGKND